jgi:sugar transferase (PEP-CTERM system associated)
VILTTSYLCELYAAETIHSNVETGARIAVSIMIAFFILSAFFYVIPVLALGRGLLSLSLLIFGVLQFIIHRIFNFAQRSAPLAQKIMILGVGPLAEVIERTISFSPRNLVFAGFIRPYEGVSTVADNSIVGTVDQIEEILSREKVSKLIVSMTERRGHMPVKNLLTCKLRGIEIIDSPTFYEEATGKLLIEGIQPSWFIYSNGFRNSQKSRTRKRILDVLTATLFIIVLLPLVPLIALLIKISSPGPVLFKQKRVGEKGLEFTLIKFRTMCKDAERDTGAVWASEDDPRITRLGYWMRKMRIDEIPQLINVLKGDMSFIGPRPERREFVEKLSETIPYYGKRHFVKPGLTGWAQVRYAYGASEEDALEKLRYDLYYIKNYSIILDIIILIETIKVVLLGRGGR